MSSNFPELEKGFYRHSLDPEMKWLARPTGKCDGKFYEKKVLLLVNWFKFSSKIYDREYYEYEVKMTKEVLNRKPGKPFPKKTEIPIPDRAKLFWQHLRHEKKQTDFILEDYVFDEKDTVYSVCRLNTVTSKMLVSEKVVKKDSEKKDEKDLEKKILYTMILTYRKKFHLNFSRENPEKDEEANRSYKFLKNVMTQKVRYAPFVNEEIKVQFAKNFVYDNNSILRVPESFHDPNRFEQSLEVAPRIEAWFGIYIGIKELFDGEPVLNFAIVDKLFYNAPKMSLLDYLLLIVDPQSCNDDVRKDLKTKLMAGKMTIRQAARPRIRQLLENLKLKCAEVWDNEMSRLTERHLTFLDLCEENSLVYKVTGKSDRGRNAKKYDTTLFKIYEENKKFIEFPHLPLVKVKSGAKEYAVPMEHLEVHEKPQRYKNRIDLVMQDKFLKRATRKPHDYKENTLKMLKELDFSSEELNFVERFGLCSKLQMIECPGKVLKEPMLVNSVNEQIKMTPVIRGFQEKQLNVVPEKELCCAVFVVNETAGNPCLEENDVVKFYTELIGGCKFRGIRIGANENRGAQSIMYDATKNEYAFYKNCTLNTGIGRFEIAATEAKNMFERLPDKEQKVLMFIIISKRQLNAYGFVKHYCDHTIGVANQHITSETVTKALASLRHEKGSKRIFYQIALKINAKLGGINQELDWSEIAEISPEEKERRKTMPLTMYVGIDVTHPTSYSGIDYSIAAVVASINPGGTIYRNMIVTQEECRPGERAVAHGRERTDILEAKFVKLLREFAENNDNRAPAHIVVYRDGVSDSEMLRVSHDELRSLKSEVKQFMSERDGEDPEPKYTFIVIQKRHNTRLLRRMEKDKPVVNKDLTPAETDVAVAAVKQWEEDMKESKETGIVNPSSGTTVDKLIVSKYKFDFFLASHHGVLGTSRPGHYTVMYDDKGMSQDEVYKMTYGLAFLSARCRKPISLPVPVHYAHLSCEKAKELYRTYKEHYIGDYAQPRTRHEMEHFLQTNVKYPGMSFA